MKFSTFVGNYVPAFIYYPIALLILGIWFFFFGIGIAAIRVLLPFNRREYVEDWFIEHFSPYE